MCVLNQLPGGGQQGADGPLHPQARAQQLWGPVDSRPPLQQHGADASGEQTTEQTLENSQRAAGRQVGAQGWKFSFEQYCMTGKQRGFWKLELISDNTEGLIKAWPRETADERYK